MCACVQLSCCRYKSTGWSCEIKERSLSTLSLTLTSNEEVGSSAGNYVISAPSNFAFGCCCKCSQLRTVSVLVSQLFVQHGATTSTCVVRRQQCSLYHSIYSVCVTTPFFVSACISAGAGSREGRELIGGAYQGLRGLSPLSFWPTVIFHNCVENAFAYHSVSFSYTVIILLSFLCNFNRFADSIVKLYYTTLQYL